MIIDGRHVIFKRISDGALAAGGGKMEFIWATEYDTDIPNISEVYNNLKLIYPNNYNMAYEIAETPLITFARVSIAFNNEEDEAEFMMRMSQ